MIGNSVDIEIRHKDCEVRADIKVERKRTVRIWGRIVDCHGKGVENVLVKLVRFVCHNGKPQFIGVAHTVSDCNGFYQFEVDGTKCNQFKIIASKSASGKERTICDCK